MALNTHSATLTDFTNFHGMLASPAASQRCIDAFNGGVILFMPRSYPKRGMSVYHYPQITLLAYYSLVVYSFTALSTLCGMTAFQDASEDFVSAQGMKGDFVKDVTADIVQYVKEKSAKTPVNLRIVRRFAYRFNIPGIQVQMFHLADEALPPGKVHLVEIYEDEMHLPFIFVGLFGILFSLLGRSAGLF
ncbi:hypothetical protein BC830DRAFT_1150944 [Chytriomyces sp. MP71]|nr:hypothetical protein BC830DRAFT_1150944 [Chytriomyces sp. MP71]